MAVEDDSTWLLELETALLDGLDAEDLINITRGRIIPEENRAKIWYTCLGGGTKISNFDNFDEIFDLPEQSAIRNDCRGLVDKLGNEEEDKVSVVCDLESIFTHYCKSRHLKYDTCFGWSDIITPLLAAKMPRNHIYICFEEILEKYIPRDYGKGAPVFHLLRLLLLYHDPELTTFLDSRKITPDVFATTWMRSLFSSVCGVSSVMSLWDIYFQERDPFFILYLSLVILVNAREQIMGMAGENRQEIVDTVTNMPAALSVEDVPDFCSLARYYILKTPSTFRKEFATVIFGSVYMGMEGSNRVGDLPLSQALCLPVSAEEIVDVCEGSQHAPQELDQVQFFLVDCRPAEQYNVGHLPNAFHLDSSLMLQAPSNFQTAVQGLFLAQRQAVAAQTPGCGNHLCFIGSGREQEDQYVHMVVASFLQRATQYVSLAKGGYQALHDLLVHNLSESLADHDSKRCLVCCPDSQSHTSDMADHDDFSQPPKTQGSLFNKFSSFSSVFKSKSVEMKEKLVEYINNTNVEGGQVAADRHVSSLDKGRLYRNQGSVFCIEEEEYKEPSRVVSRDVEDVDQLEVVKISQWLKKPDIMKSFTCHQVKENGFMYPCHLLLTDTLLFVVHDIEGRAGEGHVTARRTLSSIIKITSKKRHPDLITFKYGTSLSDGDITITDMDRFLIPKASEATKVIKQQIMSQINDSKS